MDGGGDGSFDPCECICSYDGAMRRLISLLRSSQSYCTDNECFMDPPGPTTNGGNNGGFNVMFFMIAWFIAAVLLFLLRPQNTRQGDEKPVNQDQGRNPPAPPIH